MEPDSLIGTGGLNMPRQRGEGLTALDAASINEVHHKHMVEPIFSTNHAPAPRPVLRQSQPSVGLDRRQTQGRAACTGPGWAALALAADTGSSERAVSCAFARRWLSAAAAWCEHQQGTRPQP